ncbi:MAG: glycosyl hydrolase 53 family protein [Mageeibacillus sp.]|jgi:arabinogalactan endo-1,4-beta-galactosidase|nr:glycosyl hydrolase 53 family protein [Mageeibacillus sp.]
MIRLFSRKVISIVTVFVLIMGIAAGVPGLHFEVSADSVYEISLNTAVATVGEKTEFTATVKIDGTQVTDLAGSGLALYWWNTTGDCALDSSEGLANSATFSSSGDINLRLKLMSTSDWSTLTEVYPKITVSEASSEGYSLKLSQTEATVAPGQSVDLSATVKSDGQTVSDLSASGLHLWWWTDSWNSHSTGNSDAVYSNYDSNSGNSLAATVTFPTAGTYYICAELKDASSDVVDPVYVTVTVTDSSSEEEGYSLSLNKTEATVAPGQSVDLSATVKSDGQTVSDLSASGLHLWWWTDSWNSHSTGNSDAVYSNYDSNSGNSLAATVTFPTAGTYYICAELKDASSDVVDPVYVTVTVTDSSSEEKGYSLSLNKTEATVAPGQSVDLSATVKSDGQTVSDLSASGLHLWWWTDSWNSHSTGNSDAVYSNYDSNSGNSLAATVTFPTAGTYYICAELKDASSDVVDPVYITVTVEEDTAVKSDINVAKVSNLSSDFILGVDISSAISEFDSGVVYYDYDSNKIGNISDFCVFLKSMGINTVRIRVWNDPYDSEGNGYGGGDCDVAKAKLVADACENAGLNMLVDFHVSDFWCDPSKQTAPKEWSNY